MSTFVNAIVVAVDSNHLSYVSFYPGWKPGPWKIRESNSCRPVASRVLYQLS